MSPLDNRWGQVHAVERRRREDLVRELAPLAPPCFESRSQWLEWLIAGAEAQRQDKGTEGPLILQPGLPVRFNHSVSYCEDCDKKSGFADRQMALGKCRPDYVIAQALRASLPTETTKETAPCN